MLEIWMVDCLSIKIGILCQITAEHYSGVSKVFCFLLTRVLRVWRCFYFPCFTFIHARSEESTLCPTYETKWGVLLNDNWKPKLGGAFYLIWNIVISRTRWNSQFNEQGLPGTTVGTRHVISVEKEWKIILYWIGIIGVKLFKTSQ